MQAHLESIKRQGFALRYEKLSIDDKALRFEGSEGSHDLGEIACQRLSRLRFQPHIRALSEKETAKAVPLWFKLPLPRSREFGDQLGFHRFQMAKSQGSADHQRPTLLCPSR